MPPTSEPHIHPWRRAVLYPTEIWLCLFLLVWAAGLTYVTSHGQFNGAYSTMAAIAPQRVWAVVPYVLLTLWGYGAFTGWMVLRLAALVGNAVWWAAIAGLIWQSPNPGYGWAIYGVMALMAMWSCYHVADTAWNDGGSHGAQ